MPKMIFVFATAAALLTSGCAGYTCEHEYGLAKGTSDFANCVSQERQLNVLRAAIILKAVSQLGNSGFTAPQYSCSGTDQSWSCERE